MTPPRVNKDTNSPTERLGDALRRGAGLGPVGPSDLSADFQAGLRNACSADANVVAVWLAWLTHPDAPSELVCMLKVDRPEEPSIRRLPARVRSLGGPRLVATIVEHAPDSEAFYRRNEPTPQGAPARAPVSNPSVAIPPHSPPTLTPGPIIILTDEASFDERTRGLVAPMAEYVRGWEDLLQILYGKVSDAAGDRALFVTLGTAGRHHVWIVALSGTLEPDEEAFVAEHQDRLRAPTGVTQPVMFAVTFRVGPQAPAGTRPPAIKLPDELLRLKLERTGTIGGTIDEYLNLFWA